jgi:hypothetical protein
MFTTLSTTKQPRPGVRHSLIALVLGICVLAIPASASGSYGSASDDGGNSSVADNISRNAGFVAPDHTSLNASLNSPTTLPADDSPANVSSDPRGGYSSLNAISGSPADEPTLVSGSPSAGDPFDWGDAALGAGITMAMVAIGGAALLTLRRRTAVSPSA